MLRLMFNSTRRGLYAGLALFMLFGPRHDAFSQQLFETRAVWFATVLGDGNWPESPLDSAEKQEADLRDRIRTAAANGINTFVFQAVSRGDAMYPSNRLPWAWQLRGPGEDPGYDPLAVAIDEAHKLGMELHAWINVFRVGDGTTVERYQSVSDPAHVYFAHPEWVKEVTNDEGDITALWIDPSSAEARAWLVGNVIEIVERYDVDAVHYDFIRYHQGGYSDDNVSFTLDPRGFSDIDDWRRDNVTLFVQESYNAIMAEKPWVKVGATPIGHYRGPYEWGALLGYSDVFQESRAWVPGATDYLAPQIYWSIGQEHDFPRFEVLAEEWVAETTGPVFVGIAAYGADPDAHPSPFPPADLTNQIELTRTAGAAGHVFFRYDHFLKYIQHIRPTYQGPALAAPMTHRFEYSFAPPAPANPAISKVGRTTVELSWDAVNGHVDNPVRGYAVFRREGSPPDVSNGDDLFAVVGATTFSEGDFQKQPSPDVYYRVAAVTKLGTLSEPSAAVSTASVDLAVDDVAPGAAFRILSIYPNPTASSATVAFELDRPAHTTVRVFDALGRVVADAFDAYVASGRREVLIDLSRLSAGTYFVEVRADDGRVVRQVVRL